MRFPGKRKLKILCISTMLKAEDISIQNAVIYRHLSELETIRLRHCGSICFTKSFLECIKVLRNHLEIERNGQKQHAFNY